MYHTSLSSGNPNYEVLTKHFKSQFNFEMLLGGNWNVVYPHLYFIAIKNKNKHHHNKNCIAVVMEALMLQGEYSNTINLVCYHNQC